MKSIKIVSGLLLIVIGIALAVYRIPFLRNNIGYWVATSSVSNPKIHKEQVVAKLEFQDTTLLQDGDIILRRGFGDISDKVMETFNEPYGITHCGVLRRKGTAWMVINCESNPQYVGMQEEELFKFVRNSHPNSILVSRLKASQHEKELFLSWMEYYIKENRQFDYLFNDKDTTELYCSEVIDLALQKTFEQQILVKRLDNGVISAPHFENFYDTTHFKLIINQFNKLNTLPEK
jgi:hypothetical protein